MIVHVEDRVVADEPVVYVVRPRRQRSLDMKIEDGLARLEHLAVKRLDLCGELLSEHLSECAAEVFLDGDPVQRRERVVHPHIAEVRVHERQPTGAAANTASRPRGLLRVMARGRFAESRALSTEMAARRARSWAVARSGSS